MVAIVGFWVQALVVREEPVAGLTKHIADPFGHNIVTCVYIAYMSTIYAWGV